MKRDILFSSVASNDLEDLFQYYNAIDPATASKYYYGIIGELEKVQIHQDIGRIVPEFYEDGISIYREIIFEIFRIIYRIEKEKIIIIKIINQRECLNLNILFDN